VLFSKNPLRDTAGYARMVAPMPISGGETLNAARCFVSILMLKHLTSCNRMLPWLAASCRYLEVYALRRVMELKVSATLAGAACQARMSPRFRLTDDRMGNAAKSTLRTELFTAPWQIVDGRLQKPNRTGTSGGDQAN